VVLTSPPPSAAPTEAVSTCSAPGYRPSARAPARRSQLNLFLAMRRQQLRHRVRLRDRRRHHCRDPLDLVSRACCSRCRSGRRGHCPVHERHRFERRPRRGRFKSVSFTLDRHIFGSSDHPADRLAARPTACRLTGPDLFATGDLTHRQSALSADLTELPSHAAGYGPTFGVRMRTRALSPASPSPASPSPESSSEQQGAWATTSTARSCPRG